MKTPESEERDARATALIWSAAKALASGRETLGKDWDLERIADVISSALEVPVFPTDSGVVTPPPATTSDEWLEVGPQWHGALQVVAVVSGYRFFGRILENGQVVDLAAEMVVRLRPEG